MPSFVSRLEESIFAAAWVRADALFSMREEIGRATALAYCERVVQQFREAEREAAKRAMPSSPVRYSPVVAFHCPVTNAECNERCVGARCNKMHQSPFAPVVAEPSWMNDETRMIEKVPSE